jgi:hypothetical protein
MTADECAEGKGCCGDSELDSQEYKETPLRRRREEDEEDMDPPQQRREHTMPELALDLGRRADIGDAPPISTQESSIASRVDDRITRVLGLLDKVDSCIAEQGLVREAKVQEVETWMQEADTEPEIEVGADPAKVCSNEEDSSDSSSADGEQGAVDGRNYL